MSRTDVAGIVLLGICGLISLLSIIDVLPFGTVTFLAMVLTGVVGAGMFTIDGDSR